MNHHELEEGETLALDFTKLGKVASCGEDLIPAVPSPIIGKFTGIRMVGGSYENNSFLV